MFTDLMNEMFLVTELFDINKIFLRKETHFCVWPHLHSNCMCNQLLKLLGFYITEFARHKRVFVK